MRSTFMGLEASKRGLFTQQSALYTTGHNISNANTIGYSRQRVNMQATPGFPMPGLNSPTFPGHMGTGVEAGSIQRMRDEFIDRQFRQETNKLGYYESRTKAISQMEDVMNEPSEFSLNKAFEQLWQSLHVVSGKPGNASTRVVAISNAKHLADSFNYMDTQLRKVQGNMGNEIDASTKEINSILKRIATINEQIQKVEPNGYVPNDLYDARDVLVDQLNEYLPVSTQRVPSGGLASDVAEGSLTITFNGVELVNGKDYAALSTYSGTPTNTGEFLKDKNGNFVLDENGNQIPLFSYSSVNGDVPLKMFSGLAISKLGNPPSEGTQQTTVAHSDLEPAKGKLLSLINSYGYEGANGEIKGYYPETMKKIDELAKVFAQVFNTVHKEGYDLNGDKGEDFFVTKDGSTTITAGNIKVSDVMEDSSKLAASSGKGEEGNGKWAIELANLQSKAISSGIFTIDVDLTNPDDASATYDGANGHLEGATFESFFQGIIGKVGVDGKEALKSYETSGSLYLTIANNRASMSSVHLDEEMTNMITFQQAYNANARMITVVDEILEKVINGMGRVGL